MYNRPIGIFDSGLGGLTAYAELRKLMPNRKIIYFGDTARMPYGTKTPDQLKCMALQDMDFLYSLGVEAIIAACGTVSSNAANVLESYEIPVTGVLKPAVDAMAQIPGSAPLAVIATPASISSGAFRKALEDAVPGRPILDIACPDFVTLIESGHSAEDDPLVMNAVEEYLRPVKEAGAAALLLGCTHYGIIRKAIHSYLGENTVLISASKCAAKHMADIIGSSDAIASSDKSVEGVSVFYTSGSIESFSELGSTLLGRRLNGIVKHVEPKEI